MVPRQLSAARLSAVQRQLPSAGSRRQLPLAVQRQLPSSGSPVNCLSAGSRRQLSFASPSHFRIRRDFRSKNPLSGFAPKQTKESSALAAHPHSATSGPRKVVKGLTAFTPKLTSTFSFGDLRRGKVLLASRLHSVLRQGSAKVS